MYITFESFLLSNMGDVQRLQRINNKITLISQMIDEIRTDRQDLARSMGEMIGLEFLEAFEDLAKLDKNIEDLKRDKIRLENLRDYIE